MHYAAIGNGETSDIFLHNFIAWLLDTIINFSAPQALPVAFYPHFSILKVNRGISLVLFFINYYWSVPNKS